jgi:hypothetical protein
MPWDLQQEASSMALVTHHPRLLARVVLARMLGTERSRV